MKTKTTGALCALLVVWTAGVAIAQDKPPAGAPPQAPAAAPAAPVITEVQQLTLANLIKDVELAQLRAQAAQVAFERAQTEIQKQLGTMQVEGYDVRQNPQTGLFEYVKKEKAKHPGA